MEGDFKVQLLRRYPTVACCVLFVNEFDGEDRCRPVSRCRFFNAVVRHSAHTVLAPGGLQLTKHMPLAR